jgi:hypothetical protein
MDDIEQVVSALRSYLKQRSELSCENGWTAINQVGSIESANAP